MIEYNKNINKSGRLGSQSLSPRDKTLRNQSEATANMVASLTEQLLVVRSELDRKNKVTSISNDEEFNNAVIEAVNAAIKDERERNSKYILELENKLKSNSSSEVKLLEQKVAHLEEVIKAKEEIIEALKSTRNVVVPESNFTDSKGSNNRPKLNAEVIDPSNSTDKMISNINPTEIISTTSSNMSNKVNKLKDILGGGLK